MNGVMSQAEMVEELMAGLKIQPQADNGDIRCWRLDDNDVVRLAQACVRQVASMKADPEAAPLALQATVTKNAWAVAEHIESTQKGSVDGALLCPYPETDPLSSVWCSAFASRVRWIKSGKVTA